LAGAAVVAVAAAGCGSSSKTAASSTTSGGSASSTTVGAPSTPTTGDTTGVTATTITLGQIATSTGPVPGLFQNAADGMDAYVAYINSTGGVDGRQLKVVHMDDGFNCNTYTNDLKTLSTTTFATVGTFSVIDGCGLSVLKANPSYPTIEGYILTTSLFALPNAYTPSPQPPGYPTTGAIWIKNKFPNDITHTASLYSVASKTSFDSLSSAYKAEGFKYVYTRGVGLTETNFTSDVLRMKADGVKIIDFGAVDAQDIADFIQEADQQGFHPDAIIGAQAYDENLFKYLGKSNADNLYMPLLFPLYLGQDSATNPQVALLIKWMQSTHKELPNLYGVTAWNAGSLFTTAMKTAGGTPSRVALLKALAATKSFDSNGLMPPSNPGDKKSAVCMVIAGVKNGQFVRVDPATKGFECNGTYNNITEAQATS
jgi:ABC-type branched-subunit amino acid transport system substrate-binding protein